MRDGVPAALFVGVCLSADGFRIVLRTISTLLDRVQANWAILTYRTRKMNSLI